MGYVLVRCETQSRASLSTAMALPFLDKPAFRPVARIHGKQRGLLRAATLVRPGATRRKAASTGYCRKRRHCARNIRQRVNSLAFERRNARDEPLGIRVARALHKAAGVDLFYDLAQIHDVYARADTRDDTQIMADKKHRHALGTVEVAQKVQNLFLSRRRVPWWAHRRSAGAGVRRAPWRSSRAGACRR